METFERNWYVLHTYSGYENKVKANIESRAQSMGMGDYIFRVVVPEETEKEVKNGKEKEIVHKTFPGYVLVEMIMTDDSWYIVRNTPGVTGFVGSHGAGSKPAPLLQEEINHFTFNWHEHPSIRLRSSARRYSENYRRCLFWS